MEIFAPYERLWLLGFIVYAILFLWTLIISIRLDRFGIRIKSKVKSFFSETSTELSVDGENDSPKTSHFAVVEFVHENITREANVQIGQKFMKKKYKEELPIIYLQNKFKKPTVDNRISIYQSPLVLAFVFVFCVLLSIITIALQNNN